MSDAWIGPYARWFDDFAVGQRITTHGRTIVEADGSRWAALTGDFHPLHLDDTISAQHGLFGGRFPPGLMTVAISSGLMERLGLFHGTALAVLEQTVRYLHPVRFGDTIHLAMEVTALAAKPDRGRGVITLTCEIVNQDGQRCSEGTLVMMLLMRPADDVTPAYGD